MYIGSRVPARNPSELVLVCDLSLAALNHFPCPLQYHPGGDALLTSTLQRSSFVGSIEIS